MRRLVAPALLLLFAACGEAAPIARPAGGDTGRASGDETARPTVVDGVGTFTSVPWGFETNSYWIEGPDGVVVIDTQFLPSEAERLIATIEASTDRPIVLAIVLHPNPDKFNGTEIFRRRGIRVISSAQVVAAIPHVAEIRRAAFLERYAPDYPATDPEVESFGDASTTLEIAGLQLGLHVLGEGCSEAHVVVTWNGHLFGGDLLVSRTHAWLELGHAHAWRDRVVEMRAMSPSRVHPGRGPSGGAEILDETDAYLARVVELVTEARTAGFSRDEGIARVREAVVAEHPGYGYDVFLFGLAAVWDEEATWADVEAASAATTVD